MLYDTRYYDYTNNKYINIEHNMRFKLYNTDRVRSNKIQNPKLINLMGNCKENLSKN